MVFTASLLDVQHNRDSLKNKLASLVVVSLVKGLKDVLLEKLLYFKVECLDFVQGDKNYNRKERENPSLNFKECEMPNKLKSADTNLSGQHSTDTLA